MSSHEKMDSKTMLRSTIMLDILCQIARLTGPTASINALFSALVTVLYGNYALNPQCMLDCKSEIIKVLTAFDFKDLSTLQEFDFTIREDEK